MDGQNRDAFFGEAAKGLAQLLKVLPMEMRLKQSSEELQQGLAQYQPINEWTSREVQLLRYFVEMDSRLFATIWLDVKTREALNRK